MARNESRSVSATGFAGAAPCASASPIGASEKLTTRAPEPLSRSRRETLTFMIASPSRHAGRALDSGQDAHVGAAAAEIVGERLANVGVARLAVAREQRHRFHDHAIDAVAALRRLCIDEGLLHRMRPLRRAQALERDDLLCRREARERHLAGAHRLAIDMYRASAALAEPAAEARAPEREIVAQRIEERHLGIIDGDPDGFSVDVQQLSLRHGRSPGCGLGLFLSEFSLPAPL